MNWFRRGAGERAEWRQRRWGAGRQLESNIGALVKDHPSSGLCRSQQSQQRATIEGQREKNKKKNLLKIF